MKETILYLDDNGVTIKATEEAKVGIECELNGNNYKIVSEDQLREMITNGDDLSSVVTTKVTSMDDLFRSKEFVKGDISSWDVSNVTDMNYMFSDAKNFNQDISSWDVSNVTNMSCMFSDAKNFNQDISSWDVSNVTDMWGMFSGEFNQDISSWDVSNVTNMSCMFSDAKNFNQDISSWDVSNVTDMSRMFYDAVKFNQDISSWDVSNVTDMSGMFSGAEKFNQDISSWDVSNVTNMGDMFELANNFNQDISSWDVSNVTNMCGMFFKAISFNQNLKKWKVNSVLDCSWFSKNADSWKLIKPKFEMNATNLRTKTIDELTPYNDIDFLNKSDSQVSNFSKRGYYRFTYLTLDLHNPTYIWIDNLTIPKNICEEELGSAFAESIGLEVLADDDNDEGIPVGESCVYVETLMYKYDKGIEQIGWIEEEIMKYDIEKWWEIDIIFIPIEFIKTYINEKNLN